MFNRSISIVYAMIVLSVGSRVAIAASPIVSSNKDITISQNVEQKPRENRRSRGFQNNNLMDKLNLSENQKQQISSIRQKYKEQISQTKNSVRTEQQALQSLMTGNASDAQIRTQYQKVAQLRQDLYNLNFESLLEMRQVLTPSQRNQLSQLIQQRREKVRQPNSNQ